MRGDQDGNRLADFESLVLERHSCRAYLARPVPRYLIEWMLGVAQRAASDCNIQPWQVMLLTGEPLDRLRDSMYHRAASGAPQVADIPPIASYSGVFQVRRRDCGWSLYGALGIQKGDRAASHRQALENFRFFGAPHLALISTHASLGARALLDCGGYVAAFMLAAQAAGVGTVAQASIAYRADVIREQLQLQEDQHVVCAIAFGWPDPNHPANGFRTKRANVAEVVEFRGG